MCCRGSALFLLFVLYLSLLYAGQTFMTYQWDLFLLETGFAALLLSFATTPGIWLLRWLLFRFMFMSGVVKLLSGDPNWWNLSALDYHFLTQPLPTPLAWYAAQMPAALLVFATGGMFFVELVLPFLIFARADCGSSRPSASCCSKSASSSPATTTGSIFRPCCCACRCSTTRRCGRYCRSPAELRPRPTAPRRAGEDRRQRIGAADRVLQPGADGSALRRQ